MRILLLLLFFGIFNGNPFGKAVKAVLKAGLKDEDQLKIKNGEEPFYWFFPTKKISTPHDPDDVDYESVTGPVATAASDPSVQSLFVCNECSASFIRHWSLLRHLDNGRHKIRPEKVSQYDFALGLFKRVLEEVQQGVGIAPLAESFKEYQEAPKEPRPKGWALRSTKKSAKYDPVANKMVTDLFEEFFRNGKKLRAEEAEKRMRERKDILPSQRMNHDQIKNRITTLLAKKRDEEMKKNRKRNRRAVAVIKDMERELEEEGASIEGIEEEVEDIHEDDLLFTSDSIYDMIHSNLDEFFYQISEPIFPLSVNTSSSLFPIL